MRFVARTRIVGLPTGEIQPGDIVEMRLASVAEMVPAVFGGLASAAEAALVPVDEYGNPIPLLCARVPILRRLQLLMED